MPADVVELDQARRAAVSRAERRGLALVIQAEPGAVRVLVGTEDDGVELGLTPELADSVADELRRAAADARRGGRG